MLSLADVSRKLALMLWQNSWASSAETARSSSKSHLLPSTMKGKLSGEPTIDLERNDSRHVYKLLKDQLLVMS